MRIALVSTVASPVRQVGSHSVESLLWVMSRELTRRGHEVTVFGTAGSEPYGELVATLPGPYNMNGSPDWQLCEWINLCRAVEQSRRFDVMHSHAYLWGIPLEPLSRAPMIHTMHILPDADHVSLRTLMPQACVIGASHYQWSRFPQLPPTPVIYYGVDYSQFTLQTEPADYVAYLGRFTPGKGPIQAIETARRLGLRLLLAGPDDDYYIKAVKPLVDGHSVEYIGPVSGATRNQFLGGARALLFPLQAPEVFGLVQVEAMLCGTPVAAIGIGAEPEIIDHGITGCSAASVDDFDRAVLQALTLDRRRVRERAEARFSAERMARNYLDVSERLIASQR